ncbi:MULTISPECIES: MFS transporter [Halolamina]|uniref:MFS transporter, OFA family, oxalate/formate antiporter n=1 Tax=Halolamina pelagica TaxID=699431 RepID=A0A1I5W922_9EURY|nr:MULTISPECIES: MFS transporter [Halolamina]NHX37508.1 OFA family MFS transporter [Halolamina sp. R1-12]SFQ16183.1 MFS transporter, OFA family, oxalate/formate antiporter [Halolamina pelagica]
MDRRDLRFSGWGLVLVAALALGAAGIYQFAWSSIRLPIGERVGAPEPALGTVFTLFVVFQTLGQFPAGWVRDRYGPRLPSLVGALCLTGGFSGIAVAGSLPAVYLAYAVGGIGVAIVYTVSINTTVKWFDDRRGLATGVVGMCFSGFSFLAIPAIRRGVADTFEGTLFALAAGVGGAALVAALVLRDPPSATSAGGGSADAAGAADDEADDDETAADIETAKTDNAGQDIHPTDERAWTWRQAVRTWQFWLLYAVFIVSNGVGLMIIGKIVSFATALSLPAAAATASASAVALSEAGGVVIGGSLSDRLGRRRTVAASLVLSGVSLAGAVAVGVEGLAAGFVALVGAAAFFRTPMFAVFPSLVAEYYGRTYSSENYAALYTAKLFGGVFAGTVASALVISIGWAASFALGAVLIALAGVAVVFLRPVEAGGGVVRGS